MTTTMKHRKTLKLGGMLAMLLMMSSCAPACETGGDTSGGGRERRFHSRTAAARKHPELQ